MYIQQTKFRCNKIYIQKHSAERKIWAVSCTSSLYFLALFECSLYITEMFKGEILFLFTVLLVNELMPRIAMGVPSWSHACGHPQVFCKNITMTCAYSFS